MYYYVSFPVVLYLTMTIMEMVVMKYIYITKFSMIAAINENFISATLIIFNTVTIAFFITIHMMYHDAPRSTAHCYFRIF